MNETPEEAGARPVRAAPTAQTGGTDLAWTGSVCASILPRIQRCFDQQIRLVQAFCGQIPEGGPFDTLARASAGATERGGSGATGAPAERPAEAGVEAEGASEGGPTGPTENEQRSAEHDRAERGIPSSGWREVAAACHATGGQTHESDPGSQYPASYAAFRGQRGCSRASQALTRRNRGGGE